jgi:Putative Ig domain
LKKRYGTRIGCLLVLAALTVGCGGGGGDSEPAAAVPGPAAGNAPPTIQGQPATSVVAGQSYTFRPTATDADGNQLTFAATNLPSWASLNTSNGAVSGTPTSADVGTYSGITITVSDGTASASLAAFAITVSDVASGSATLSWVAPSQNADGSALTDLAGYQILYGRSTSELGQTISLTNPSVTTYVIENLSGGTWYFAVASVNSQGVTSSPSNVASKTIS